jgi:hypothetical protein
MAFEELIVFSLCGGCGMSFAVINRTTDTRPRKTLGWRTPAEALNDHLVSLQQGGVTTTP